MVERATDTPLPPLADLLALGGDARVEVVNGAVSAKFLTTGTSRRKSLCSMMSNN